EPMRTTFSAPQSIITPLYNGERWIDQCFDSVLAQNFGETLEISVYDDSSTDGSPQLLQSWKPKLEARGIRVCISSGASSDPPKGVGFAKNRAVRQSCGKYLCFLDIDDIMHPDRIQKQYEAATRSPPNIVGSRFHRLPEGSTERYSSWANLLGHEKLEVQVFTSHGPTVIMPTWFCSRQVFEAVGGFDERGKGIPEDLIFFYRHLDLGGRVVRVDCDLLTYRYHPQQTTFSISESTIWDVRMERLRRTVLVHWTSFTIWNAGKQGRRFYRSLDPENRRKGTGTCRQQVSPELRCSVCVTYMLFVGLFQVYFYEWDTLWHVLLQDLTDGSFEANLASLNLKEGVDYIHFA
ncbi:glycosyltransferase, putative, partial [Ixodes scapularis]